MALSVNICLFRYNSYYPHRSIDYIDIKVGEDEMTISFKNCFPKEGIILILLFIRYCTRRVITIDERKEMVDKSHIKSRHKGAAVIVGTIPQLQGIRSGNRLMGTATKSATKFSGLKKSH